MPPSRDDIQGHIARIAASPGLSNSQRLRELLQYTVTEVLEGRGTSLKEAVLGVAVFGQKPGYDSDANPIVRVEFARLRKKLQQYYGAEGAGERWRILFTKGSYAPEFVRMEQEAAREFAGSVVVLPFACPGSNPDDEYFADGLTDELITALTRVPGLKVIARTSSFTFKGRASDIRGIGAKLQVDTAIEGSLRREGDLLRIHVHLLNTRDASYIWAEKYERHLRGVFQLQEEIAAAIVAALKMQLPRQRSAAPRIASPEAHALYLKGRFWWHRWNPAALGRAAVFFQQAIENDPVYAAAYSGLADCLYLQGYYGYGRPRDLMARAQACALKALELEPQLCEAHCSLASVTNAWEWNYRECGRLLRRCLELNPNYATAVAKYGNYLCLLDRYEEATDWLTRALVLDPLSPSMHADLANISALRGLDELFEQEAARVLEMDPAMVKVYWLQMKTRAACGNWRGAVEAAECALRHMPEDPVTLGFAAAAYGGSGNVGRAAELRGKLESLSQFHYVPYAARAYAHDEPGGEEIFFQLMKQAVEERDAGARNLRLMRRFTHFASDPRYGALLESVGLSDRDVAQVVSAELAS